MHALQNLKLDDPGPISVDQAQQVLEIVLKHAQSSAISSHDRQCCAFAFGVMHKKRPAAARKLYMQIAQLIVKNKQDALAEILGILKALKKSTGPPEVKEVLDAKQADPNLKLLALQSLGFSAQIPLPPVESIYLAAEELGEPGKMAAYRLFTRLPKNELSKEHLRAIKLLAKDLQRDKKPLVSPNTTPVVSQPSQTDWRILASDQKWQLIEPLVPALSNKDAVGLLKHMTSLQANADTNFKGVLGIYKQLAKILAKESLLLPISNALFNLGQRCRPDPLYLEIWTLAVELEMKRGAYPSLYEKTARFAQGIAEETHAPFLPVLARAVDHLCTADPFFKGNVLKPLGPQWHKLSIALAQVARVYGIDAFAGIETSMVLLLMISPDHADQVMKHLTPNDNETQAQYACLYYSATKKARPGLSGLLPSVSSLTRARLLAVLAQTSELRESYRLSKEALSVGITSEFAIFLEHQGFFKLLKSYKKSTPEAKRDPTDELVALAEKTVARKDYTRALRLFRHALESIQKSLARTPESTRLLDLHMDCCMRLSQLYAHVGNARDATLYLKDSIDKATKSNAALRLRVYTDAWNALATSTGQEPLPVALQDADDLIRECVQQYPPLSNINTGYNDCLSVYSQVVEELDKDPLYGMVVDSARSMPQMCVGSHKKKGIAVEFLKNAVVTLSVELPAASGWLDRDKHRRLYYDAASLLTALAHAPLPENLYRTVEKPKHSYVVESRTCDASSDGSISSSSNGAGDGQSILGGIIVVSINVASNGELQFSRKVPGRRELLISLPPSRIKLLSDEQPLGVQEAKTLIKDQIDKFLAHARESNQELESADRADNKAERTRSREWWKKAMAIERELVDVIRRMEAHWLGGFKGLLSVYDRGESVSTLKERLETVFATFLPPTAHKSLDVQLELEVVELFAALGDPDLERPETRDFEDLVYFVLDSLQFQGGRVAYDEIELEEILAGVQTAVKQYHQEEREEAPHHMVLIPDSKCQTLPWESMACLKRVPVSRALSLDLLYEAAKRPSPSSDNVFYLLNPGNDLRRTQEQFEAGFRLRGWKGIAGHTPPEQQILERLQTSSFYVYIGHGAGQSYLRQPAVRALPNCCPVMLMGCSSLRLQDASSFDGFGPLTDYAMAGSPLVVGNLWDVVDKDSNRFTNEVLSRVFDDGEEVCAAVCESRRACVLRYLTGGAPVVYGLPWRLAST